MYLKIILILLLFFAVAPGAVYYVSPTGNDTNPGTINLPYATIPKAMSTAVAGDTIFVRGGTHVYSTTIAVPKSGNSTKIFFLLAYPGERPLLDFSSMAVADANRGINLNRSYWHIEGLDIKGAGDNGIIITGSNNIIENCGFFENRDTGLQISGGGSNNQIINCDSYYNADPAQGNADGFAPKLDVGTGNYFYGCRAWQNSDDGYDGYLRPSNDITTTYENCWAFKNGYLKSGAATTGNGNGFKMGGSDDKTLMHNVAMKNCFAFENRVKGFDQNNNKGSMTLYNCTAHNNGMNYSISTALNTGKKLTVINCVVLGSLGSIGSFAIQQTNSWLPPFNVTLADFQSINSTAAYGPRKTDGGLPDIPYMNLAYGSQLIDAGTDVGVAYCGIKPDLGAFETKPNYSLTINALNGLVNRIPNLTNYVCGASVQLAAIPDTPYNFVNWSGDLNDSINPTTIIVNNNKIVTANFAIKQYEVIASIVGGNGNISPSSQLINHGSSVTINIFPNVGYIIASISVNGNSVPISNPLIIENVTSSYNVVVTFTIKTYSISASAVGNGSISPSGVLEINHGDSIRFTMSPATGYRIDSVFINGAYHGARSIYTFRNVTANQSISVSFVVQTQILSVMIKSGWNIVSVPLTVTGSRKSELFPSSISNAFMYNNSYILVDTLQNGLGYWIKFPIDEEISMIGSQCLSDSVNVNSGWNMIGSISLPIQTTSVTPSAGISIITPFYGYQNGYTATNTIEPGKAYWVKVSGTGKLYLNSEYRITK